MKDFLKYTLATIVGIFITSFLFSFLSLVIIGAMISAGQKPVEIRSNSVLSLSLDQAIPDRSSSNPFENFDLVNMRFGTITGLNDILKNIEKAKTDDRIKGIYLDLGVVNPGYATTEEIRNALTDFRSSGKFIIGYCDQYLSQPAYYLATVADKIYVGSTAFVEFFGMRSEITFYKNALEKLGVEVQVIRHGKYKSFVEPYTMDRMSEENRAQILTYISSIWNHLLAGISEKRSIPVNELNRIADELLVRNPQSALDLNMIDGIRYYDEVLDELKELSGLSGNREVRFVSQSKYARVPEKKDSKNISRDKIAVIYATGDIGMPFQTGSGINGKKFSSVIREARNDSSIRAIVLRVNSPGGSSLASDMIWREVDLAAKVKPVVASMGNVAASGGYYILAASDTVLASPVSITGSIGVFGLIPNAGKLLNNKLGITFDVAKTNKNSDFLALHRPLTAQERSYMQESIEKTYDEFLTVVSGGRQMRYEAVDSIAQGRVWTGTHALQNGLIDGFGGLHQAISLAAEMASLEDYQVVELPEVPGPYEQLLKDLTGESRMWLLRKKLGEEYKYLEFLERLKDMDPLQARLPYTVEVY